MNLFLESEAFHWDQNSRISCLGQKEVRPYPDRVLLEKAGVIGKDEDGLTVVDFENILLETDLHQQSCSAEREVH